MKSSLAVKVCTICMYTFLFIALISSHNVFAAGSCGTKTIQSVGQCDDTCHPVSSSTSHDCYSSGGSCVVDYQNAHCVWNVTPDPVNPGKTIKQCNPYFDSATIGCGGGGGGGGGGCDIKSKSCCSCAATDCTPDCPAGTTLTNTGLGVKTTASCQYNGESCNKNGGCLTFTNTQKCYIDDPLTNVADTKVIATSGNSPLSCTTASNVTGKEVNNTITVKHTFIDNNSNNSPVALMSWFGPLPTAFTQTFGSGDEQIINNAALGLMVKRNKSTNNWVNIFVPGFNTTGGVTNYGWVKTGTIGNGLRANIIGKNGKPIAGISNVKVEYKDVADTSGLIRYTAENNGGSAKMTFNEIGTDTAHIASWEPPAKLAGFDTLVPDDDPLSGWTSKGALWGEGALNFDGINDQVILQQDISFSRYGRAVLSNFGTRTSIAFSIWAKVRKMPKADKKSTLFSLYDTAGDGNHHHGEDQAFKMNFYDENKIQFFSTSNVYNDNGYTLTAPISTPEEWHMYTGVADFDSDTIKLYQDRDLIASRTYNYKYTSYQVDVYGHNGEDYHHDTVGSWDGGYFDKYNIFRKDYKEFFTGTIDAFNLIGYTSGTLTQAQINLMYEDYLKDTITLTYDIEFYNNLSGLSSFEKVVDGTYKISAAGMTESTLLGTNTEFSMKPRWFDPYNNDKQTIDLTNPVNDTLSTSKGTGNTYNVAWKFTDASSNIKRVIGDASVIDGVANGPINDTTSSVNNYVLGSGDTGSNLYDGSHLWKKSGTSTDTLSRTEVVDHLANTNSKIEYSVYAFDSACNYIDVKKSVGTCTGSICSGGGGGGTTVDPWLLTRGGIVYTADGSILNTPSFATHVLFASDSYWSTPSSIYKDEADLTTELLQSGGSFTPLVNAVKLSSATIGNYVDSNNKHSYWFSKITSVLNARATTAPTKYTVVTQATNYTAPASVTSITDGTNTCVNTKDCVVKVTGNMTIPSGFSCNARVTFLVQGDITVNPDVTNSSPSYGCIFVASNNITIGAGTYKSTSSTYPKYDLVDGYYIADNAISLPVADASQAVKDGLRVTGALIGFGSSTSPSIVFGRDLGDTGNTDYPALVVHSDYRLLNIASDMIGSMQDLYKQEVGFKPL